MNLSFKVKCLYCSNIAIAQQQLCETCSLKQESQKGYVKSLDNNKIVTVKFKKLHPNAVIPFKATEGSAGMDLTATSVDKSDEFQALYGTGLSVEIPRGHVGLLFPRSSIKNYFLSLSNSVGVIDSDYRGEVKLAFNYTYIDPVRVTKSYNLGDRVAQLVIMKLPEYEILEVEELSETARGECGYGSTGK